ncbi:MAG: putative bifunctional diguanylate cyclase/phosphodiesterase [Pseudonocardiaceae bacterium]
MTTDHGCDPWSLDAVAREWVNAVSTTAYVPMSPADMQLYLRDLTTRLVAALSGPSVDAAAAFNVGARLVAGDFTGPQSLSRTVEVLARVLPAATEHATAGGAGNRVIELLGALVAGYTSALRDRLFDQQEEIHQALIVAHQGVERELEASETWFREVFDSSPMGMVITETGGRIEQTNPALEQILGYSHGELLGSELSRLFSLDERPVVLKHYQRLRSGQEARFRLRCQLRHKDGGPAWVYLAASVLLDAERQPQYFATMVDDLTELHLLQEWSNHQSMYDLQTGLPNRQYFVSHLEQVLGQLEPSDVITLLYLELDGFSTVNDRLGHRFGDQMLEAVASRLRKVVADRPAMVAQVGGGEFAILIEPGDSVPDVGGVADAVHVELEEPIYPDEIEMTVTATIGVVQRRVGGADPDELLRAAGATLRRLHGKGRQQWAVFDADVDAAERAELRLAATLPSALETGELRVDYQPVVTLESGRLVGVETVLNWHHPELGVLSQDRCTQLAEQTGMVHAIEPWLLRTAAERARSWLRLPVAVNLTTSQAQDPGLVAKVSVALAQTGLRPAGLELRVPVAAIRTDTGELAGEGGEYAEENLLVLADLGVHIGLYDFGGGIGGMRCVAELPVHAVRIAQPVAQQVTDDTSRLLSQAVHALTHIVRDAGVNVIAHPVDSAEQAGCWQWVGANWGMGTFFGLPGPPQNIDRLLHAQVKG